MPAFYIVVPVLNEAPNLERLVAAFRDLEADFAKSFALHFLLIDDGSTDGTADRAGQLARGLDLQTLSHDRNYGPGRAFATAFTYLATRLQDDDWVATMEGDNTSRHELLQQMFTRSAEGYEVILASPYTYGGGIHNTSGIRVFLSHFANAFLKGCVGIHGIFTMSSFFRLFRGSALKRLQACYGPAIMERSGFEAVVEMLIKMILLEMTISEVAMVLDTSRRAGKSKMKVLRTIRSYLTLFLDRGRWVRQASQYLSEPIKGLDPIVTRR
jgi:dolichol-phosphate mannosyltransferase